MNGDRASGYLGLAARAGKVQSGEFQTEKALKKGTARLLIIACDASERTKKELSGLAGSRGVPVLELYDRETLGRLIGKTFRAAAAVCDERLARAMMETTK